MGVLIDDILESAADRLEAGRRVALCLLAARRGSTPAPPGSVMGVDDNADCWGTIGGGCAEAEIRTRAIPLLTDNRSDLIRLKLDHDFGWDDGLICGGTIHVAIVPAPSAEALRKIINDHRKRIATAIPFDIDADDRQAAHRYTLHLPPRPRLLIAGAGHISQALAPLALSLDFDVAVFDDRADLLERFFTDPVRRIAGPIDDMIAAEALDEDTSIVIVTRGHRHDAQVLRAVAERDAGYVGMIGSRRKVKLTMDELREDGVADSALERVHAPVGLAIGAVTVNEIALSIAAQLVETRRQLRPDPVSGPEPIPDAASA
jgi:xanthine dehydrogenase accessory factor